MKRKMFRLAICLLVIGNSSFAQQWNGSNTTSGAISRDGNVGIGVASPTSKLHLGGSVLGNNAGDKINHISFDNGCGAFNVSHIDLYTYRTAAGSDWNTTSTRLQQTIDVSPMAYLEFNPANLAGGLSLGANNQPWLNINGGGQVGIGTTSPTQALDVNGSIHTNASVIVDGGDLILARTTSSYGFVVRPNVAGYKNLAFAVLGGGNLDEVSVNSNLSYFSGNVGIGTATTGSYKLAVEGNIAAREIQVTLQNPFPDYVFGSNYKLRSLSSLEQYINENKHLPGVPSASEVEKNGGVQLGEMNTKLLEKVEELTLYMIEMKKENEKNKKENARIKKEIKELKQMKSAH